MGDTKNSCEICAAELDLAAKFCTNCEKYQTPVRRFWAQFNVQVILTLVPLVTVVFVYLQDKLVSHHSDVRVTLLSCDKGTLQIAATNVGDRSALIKSITVGAATANKTPTNTFPTLLKRTSGADGGSLELAPQKLAFFDATVVNSNNEKFLLPAADTLPDCQYVVTTNTVAFDHEPKPLTSVCPCAK